MLAGVTSAEYVEPPGGAGDVVSGGEGAGREEPCLVRIHSGPKCIVVVVILLAERGVAEFQTVRSQAGVLVCMCACAV